MFAPAVTEPGGAAKHARTLADGLAARGHEITLVTRDAHARRLRRARTPSGVPVLGIPGFGIPTLGGLIYVVLAPLAGLIAGRGRAALIGLELASPSLAAALVGKLTRRPYFAFTFSSGEKGELELLSARRSWPARRRLLLGAERVVTQTPFAAEEVRRLLPHPQRLGPTDSGRRDRRPAAPQRQQDRRLHRTPDCTEGARHVARRLASSAP